MPPYSREIGFVFQNYALWPHMTVFKNVAFGLKLRKLAEVEIRRKVLAALDLVGLQGREERYPVAAKRRAATAGCAGAEPGVGAEIDFAR